MFAREIEKLLELYPNTLWTVVLTNEVVRVAPTDYLASAGSEGPHITAPAQFLEQSVLPMAVAAGNMVWNAQVTLPRVMPPETQSWNREALVQLTYEPWMTCLKPELPGAGPKIDMFVSSALILALIRVASAPDERTMEVMQRHAHHVAASAQQAMQPPQQSSRLVR